MKLLDRYLLAEWLKMLGLLLAATMGLLLMAALYDDFRDLIQVNASPADMALYYGTLMPSYFSVVLPLSMLLSLLFVLSKLHRNNELTAVRAAGLNIFATTRSLWFAGIVLCGVSLVLNANVVPWSVEASRSLKEGMQFRAEAQAMPGGTVGVVPDVTFDNRREGRLWFINRYSRFTGTAYGVTVSQLDKSRREVTRIMAREGHYDAAHGFWVFKDGRETTFDPEQGELVRPVPFTTRIMTDYHEDPSLMLLIDRKAGDLSFFELRRITEFFRHENDPKVLRYEVRYYGVLFDTIGPLIIIAIAVPFSVAGVRVSPVVGVSKSIGLFFLYYVLTNLAIVLGGRGLVEPMWAALMPNLAMTGLAAWFFGRMR
jgi:lipopolysaccharide export system permease protein